MNPSEEILSKYHDVVSTACRRVRSFSTEGPAPTIEQSLLELPPEVRVHALPDLLTAQLEASYSRKKLPTLADITDKHSRIKKHLIAAYQKVPAKFRLPQKLGRFTVNEHIGDGGQSRAVRAFDESKQYYLIKYDWRNRSAKRLRDERDLLLRIAHPNVRQCFGLVTEGPIPFLVLEFLEGKNLLDAAAEATSFRHIAHWIGDIALAVDHLHRQGVIHHDIKPDNIHLNAEGVPKLIDFGLAVEEYQDGLKRQNVRRPGGTFRYMAPEQILQKDELSGQACDIYSLGASLYHVLTGESPEAIHSPVQSSEQHPHVLWEPDFPKSSGIPARLIAICRKAMSYDPQQRYASAADMAAALTDYIWWDHNRRKIFWGTLSTAAMLVVMAIGYAKLMEPDSSPHVSAAPTSASLNELVDGAAGEPPRDNIPPSLNDITADSFRLELRNPMQLWNQVDGSVANDLRLFVDFPGIKWSLLRHLQMRTKVTQRWANATVDGNEGSWSLNAVDQASDGPVELRFHFSFGQYAGQTVGPFRVDYSIKQELASFHQDINDNFQRLCECKWIEFTEYGWEYSDDFELGAKEVLASLLVGRSRDELVERRVDLHGLPTSLVNNYTEGDGFGIQKADVFMQIVCIDGEKSELRHFMVPAGAETADVEQQFRDLFMRDMQNQ